MNVTLEEIANVAGISTSTVPRALSVPSKVSSEAAHQARGIANEVGETPSSGPRYWTQTRTDMLGLIVPDISNPFFPPMIKAVQARANTQRRTVVIADVDDYAADEIRRAEFLAERVDGLIIASARSDDSQLDRKSTRLNSSHVASSYAVFCVKK